MTDSASSRHNAASGENNHLKEKIKEAKSGAQLRIPLWTAMNWFVTVATMTHNPGSKFISIAMVGLTVSMWVLLVLVIMYYISLCTKYKYKMIKLTTKSTKSVNNSEVNHAEQ